MKKIKTYKPLLNVVGAGPGDPELITLKAIHCLKNADFVLYDALVNKELLHYCTQAETIFVGKRKGCCAYTQDQINELIVQRALTKGNVVRLKGGDPFVFGRGAEEILYATSKGIDTAYIPGISSSLAVPAYQNIPLTRRGVSESFWVITGTTRNHSLSKDVYLAATSQATVVILMGMSKLAEIVDVFKQAGKYDLPVAIIQNGTTADEKVCIATVQNIQHKVAANGITNPAVIVLGEVVRNHDLMQTYEVVKNSCIAIS